jgi:ABC-2 type transport system ATP-binding protein
VSSHIVAEVAQTADCVVIIDHGRPVHQGPLAELTGSRELESTYFDVTEGEDLSGNRFAPCGQ